MPNKNSIESEIDKILKPVNDIVVLQSIRGYPYKGPNIAKQIKNLIQREVKKGRVEENERSHEVMTKAINDRLEELEG